MDYLLVLKARIECLWFDLLFDSFSFPQDSNILTLTKYKYIYIERVLFIVHN
jgi:hypothetical protein